MFEDQEEKQLTDYEVGYGKPPATSRFQPGKSGNPNGRPKGKTRATTVGTKRMFNELVLEAFSKKVTINEPEGPVRVPVIQAVLRRLSVQALNGDSRAIRLALELNKDAETDGRNSELAFMKAAIDLKYQLEEERRQRGPRGKPVFPDPDHIHVDLLNNEVTLIGPMIESEIPYYNLLHRKVLLEVQLKELPKLRNKVTGKEALEAILREGKVELKEVNKKLAAFRK